MDAETILGRGIIIPLRRKGNDFVFAEGSAAVASSLRQLLLTRKGEIRWRPDFGLNLDPLRHRNITTVLLAEIQADIITQITKFEPRAEVTDIQVQGVESGGSKISVTVVWRAVARSSKKNTVLTETQTTEVVI